MVRFSQAVAGLGFGSVSTMHPLKRKRVELKLQLHSSQVSTSVALAPWAGRFDARTVRPTGELPGQLTSFIGRRSTVEMVGKRLLEDRLVTLVGPAGLREDPPGHRGRKSILALQILWVIGEYKSSSEGVAHPFGSVGELTQVPSDFRQLP
jgi:hypothetical protein